MRLVDLKFNFDCDWLIELSDNKLSNDNLASELLVRLLPEMHSTRTNHDY